jgi:hypothetical protein
MNDQELIPIFTTNHAAEAEIFKNALEDENIRCSLEGENQASLSGVLVIRGFVRAEDADRAREILADHSSELPEDAPTGESTETSTAQP